jgi:hypothetical protein
VVDFGSGLLNDGLIVTYDPDSLYVAKIKAITPLSNYGTLENYQKHY